MTAPGVIAPVVPRSSTSGPHPAPGGVVPQPRGPLPLAELPPQRTGAAVYGASAVDDRGRIVERVVLRALGWPPRHRLSIRVAAGALAITPDPTGDHETDGRGYLRIPAALRGRCGLAIGERVLLAADPATSRLTIYPPAALDQALALHTLTNGGDPA